MEMWRRRGEATSAGLSAAPYSVYHSLYSEAVVSSIASAVALAEVGQFREAVQYVQKAAKALYEAAKDVFEQVKITVQRLVELFVEAVTRVLAWVDEHKAYLFLMAAVAAGMVALSAALNLWGLVELEKLAYAAVGAPFVAGLADAGGRAAERFRVVADRWRVDDNEKQKIEEIINKVINAPLKRERPFSKLTSLENLPPPLAVLRKALTRVENEVEKDAEVAAALVLYKTLVKNAEVYREWAELYKWARSLVKEREFAVTAREVARLREVQKRLEEVAEEVGRELNAVLTLYASHSRDLYEKLRPHLEVDVEKAEELAEARHGELSKYSDANMGTKAYAALLSIARGGLYGHAAMLLMGEGALADIVMSTPTTAHWKAKEVARGRGETVDPSYSSRRRRLVGQPSWEDRAASVLLRLLIGYGEADLKFRRVEKGGRKGFQVFRTFGGVEAPVGELWIGHAARFKVSKEELRHLVEEAGRTAPDLLGIDKAPQYVAWRATDVTTSGGRIEAGTAHPWQLRWYIALLGEPKSFGGGTNVTKEGIKPNITAFWPREREDQILRESRWLKSVLDQQVESWRELVDAIDWSRVLERVEELADELKPWIGSESANDAEREGLARRILGELALLVYFAEARRGMDDDKWREERAKRLARAVEALSGGRIAGEYADRLARAIIYYAERREERAKKRIESLAKVVGVSREEVWGVVDFVLGDMYCLARDCARDEVMRKFVAPALELVMLDKALNGKFSREEALLLFGEMYATAVAGDGTVGPDKVDLAVGGELGGGATLLRLAALYLLNELLTKELKFDVRVYVGTGVYIITATGENAVRFMRLLAVSAPSAGGGYLSPKFEEFVKEARVEVRSGNVKLTKKRRVAADLTISEAGIAVKYSIYLSGKTILLQFHSTDRSRVELAALLLRHAGVNAEVQRVGGKRDVWQVRATTDKLAAGHEELRNAIAVIVREAIARGWVDEKKAEGWLKKLEEGRVLKEGWPKYEVGLSGSGGLMVRFSSLNPDNIEREAQRFREMGLVEGKHFSVKMPEGDHDGYVYVRREGLERAAWLSVYGSGRQQELAAKFVEYILQRAERAGKKVYEKAKEIVKEGKERGSLTLKGFEKRVEVDGKEHVVKVIGWSAEFDKGRGGRKLLRIKITAEVDDVRGDYTITYGRYGANNKARGFAVARGDTPRDREADAERFSALIKALTGREPGVYRMKDGRIKIECYEGHLEGFMHYTELADVIERWLEEVGR
jgi:hypothetical protein